MSRSLSSGTLIRSRRSALAALISAVVIVLIALLAFLPLLGVLAGATASTAGLIPFPVLAVSVATILGSVLVLALLVGSATRRRTAAAWMLAAAAAVVALVVTAFPLVAVVVGSIDRAGDLGTVIGELAQRFGG